MSLGHTLRELVGQTLALTATRLELASLEALQARDRLLGRLALLLLAAVFVLLALLVATAAFALWAWPTEHRYVALACLAALYAVLGLGLGFYLWRQLSRDPGLFPVTLDVLRQDASFLAPTSGPLTPRDPAPPGSAPPPHSDQEEA